ncbi:MAG TPA: alpha/beta hydrolase [Chitinophagales bacterium]|nr:alpha/beta hydrolase [Chitinophagales bacterium]
MFKKLLFFFLILLLFVGIYVFFLRKDLTLSREYIKEKYKEPNSKFIQWKGAEIHYTESGKGFPILMIHGFGGSFKDFEKLDHLLNPNYKVIRIDVPGFGLSEFPGKPTPQTDFNSIYNEYFNFLIDTLHLDSFYVMGNSLGGMMSWVLTLEHPDKVKKLVLLNSAGYDMKEVEKSAGVKRFQNPIITAFLKRGVPYFMTENGVNRVFYHKSNLSAEKTQRMNDFWNRKGALEQIICMSNSKNYPDQNKIKNIQVPTLILWGKEDIIINSKFAERFHQDIKNSTMIVYDSCGHVPMAEYPEKVLNDVNTFFDKK